MRCVRPAHDIDAADRLRNFPVLNSGVFALRGDSPLWARWHEVMREGLSRKLDFYAEQFGLNKVVYLEDFPRNILPETSNWLVNRGLPLFDMDSRMFVEPNLPYRPIGIVHLSGGTKDKVHKLRILRHGRVLGTRIQYDPQRRDVSRDGRSV